MLAGVFLSVGTASPLALENRSPYTSLRFIGYAGSIPAGGTAEARSCPAAGTSQSYSLFSGYSRQGTGVPCLMAQRELLLSSPALWTAEIVASP